MMKGSLLKTLKPGEMNIQCFVTNNKLFSILSETHIRIDHGGRTNMLKELKSNYKNINMKL